MRRKIKKEDISRRKVRVQPKQISDKSKRILVQRFIKEYETIIAYFTGMSETPMLSFTMIVAILEKLCFISASNVDSLENDELTTEKILLLQIWEILQGDHYQGVHKRNFLMFLLAMLGLSTELPSSKDMVLKNGKALTMRRDVED